MNFFLLYFWLNICKNKKYEQMRYEMLFLCDFTIDRKKNIKQNQIYIRVQNIK